MRAPDEVVRLVRPGDGDRLAGSWLGLLERLGVDDYCTTPDWTLAWWETLGRTTSAQVALWYGPDDRLDAIVPLFGNRERLHRRLPASVSTWEHLGGGVGNADHLRILCVRDLEADVLAWLGRVARRRSVRFHSLDADSPRPRTGATVTEQTRCPRMPLADDRVSPDFRRKLTYYRRRLERRGVSFEVLSRPEDLTPDVFGRLFDLHEARWEASSGERPGFLRARAPFFAQLVARGGVERGPRLVIARRDTTVIGALLGFRFGGTFGYFQNGWDPSYASMSLGTVLIDAAVSHARDDGARTFDFMRGAGAFKYRFGAVDRVDDTVLVPAGPGGALLRWKYTAGRGFARRSGGSRTVAGAHEVGGGVGR